MVQLLSEKLNREDFLALDISEQNEFLLTLAKSVIPILKKYPSVYSVVSNSLSQVEKYLKYKDIPAVEVYKYLNHSNPNLDLSAQYDLVEEDEIAFSALDIISFTIGSVGKMACNEQNVTEIPDTVLMATPDVTVDALKLYKDLMTE